MKRWLAGWLRRAADWLDRSRTGKGDLVVTITADTSQCMRDLNVALRKVSELRQALDRLAA